MEAKALEFFIACVTAAGFGIAIAAFGCGLGQGMGLRAAVEGVARNPESSGKVTVTMLIGLALIESLCIYALVVALILIFAHPQAASIAALAAANICSTFLRGRRGVESEGKVMIVSAVRQMFPLRDSSMI